MRTAIFEQPATATLLGTPPPPPRGVVLEDGNSMDLPPGTALVRYETLEELLRPRVSPMQRVHLVSIWLVMAIGLYYLFQVSGYQRAVADIDSSQSRSITGLEAALTDEQRKVGAVNGDLDKMRGQVSVLTNDTAARLNSLDQRLSAEDRTTKQLVERFKRMDAEHGGVTMGLSPSAPAPAAAQPAQHANEPANGQAPASPTNAHTHGANLDIPLVTGAILHMNAMKQPDYWLVPRQLPSGSRVMVRVMPIEVTRLLSMESGVRVAVKVHSIEDGKDYTLTTAGEWLNE